MQRHRVGQQLAIRHQIAEEGMAHRDLAGEGDAAQRGHDQQDIGIDMAGGGQQREQGTEQRHRGQQSDQHLAARIAVGQHAGDRREKQCRRELRKADRPQQRDRAGQPKGQPAHPDVVSKAADQRDRLAAEVAAELAVFERRKAAHKADLIAADRPPVAQGARPRRRAGSTARPDGWPRDRWPLPWSCRSRRAAARLLRRSGGRRAT